MRPENHLSEGVLQGSVRLVLPGTMRTTAKLWRGRSVAFATLATKCRPAAGGDKATEDHASQGCVLVTSEDYKTNPSPEGVPQPC